MTCDEALEAMTAAIRKDAGGQDAPVDISVRVGPDGVFHITDEDYEGDENLLSTCGVLHTSSEDDWIVCPWVYNADCPGIFKTRECASSMVFFWFDWMERLYGSDLSEPDFEKDWLAVKSNRSVIMHLFNEEAEHQKQALYEKEAALKAGTVED